MLNDFITKFISICAVEIFNAAQMNLNLKFNFVTTRIISNVTIFGEIYSCKKTKKLLDMWGRVCSKKRDINYITLGHFIIYFSVHSEERKKSTWNQWKLSLYCKLYEHPQSLLSPPHSAFRKKRTHSAIKILYRLPCCVCFFILLRNGVFLL